ncbi:MAG: sulfurtransferase complex subunit TusB [Candidatus Hodarchaeota archaeon]
MTILYLVTRSPFRSSRVRTALSLIEIHLQNQQPVGLILLNDSVIACVKGSSFETQLTNLNAMGLKLFVSATDLKARGIKDSKVFEYCELMTYETLVDQIMDETNKVVSWT